MKPPKGAETVEMIDGRTYYSTDNWQTVFVIRPGEKPRRVTGRACSPTPKSCAGMPRSLATRCGTKRETDLASKKISSIMVNR